MLNENERRDIMEKRRMLNPRDEYLTKKGIEQGMEQGMEQGKKEIAKKLLQEKTLQEVIELTGLTKEQIISE